MPLSRKQILDANIRRLTAIETELTEIATAQAVATTSEAQKSLLERTADLRNERTALQNANSVLQGQIDEAEQEHQRFESEHWQKEKSDYEQEFEDIAGKIETRLFNTKKLYDDLLTAEEQAAAQWKRRGRPNSPAKSISKRNFSEFLGVAPVRALASLTGRKRRFHQLFSTHSRTR